MAGMQDELKETELGKRPVRKAEPQALACVTLKYLVIFWLLSLALCMK